MLPTRRILIFILFFVLATPVFSQLMISGGVYDSTRLVPVPMVRVKSSSGNTVYTDSLGRYSILVNDKDSISFFYRNKSTINYAVSSIKNPGNFEISLQVRLPSKYQTLKEVFIISKTHRQDSAENREKYAKIFGYQKPGIRLNESNALYGGVPGPDPNELINLFRFRRNKSLRNFQRRLLEEEEQKYIDYRFNKAVVKTLSGLESPQLDSFMFYFRPSYEFAAITTDYEFYQYILDASKLYKQGIRNIEQGTRKDEY
jgi:hypothetical protein